MTRSQSSSVILKSRLSRVMPALLTRTWIPPSSSTTRCTAASAAAESTTSQPIADGLGAVGQLQAAGCLLRGGLVEVEDRDRGALAGEALRDAEADASRCSGDDGDTAVEATHVDSLRSR